MTPMPFRLLCIFLIVFSACCAKKEQDKQHSSGQKGHKLQKCPDEWIENRMPSTDTSRVNQYFIVDGQRRELEEFDLEWIRNNCDIKAPQIVY